VITDSESSAQEIRRIFKVHPDKMRTVYLGVDTDVFRRVDGHRREPNGLIMVGRTEDRKKGILYLLQALRLLKGDDLNLKLTIVDQVGSGSMALDLIRKYELDDMVTFTGRLTTDELVRRYSAAEVAITPSLYEGFGLPAAEAMACQVPVIATTAGALPEVVKQGETGILVPPQDPHALAGAIKQLLADESMRRRMGGEGRKRVERQFSWAEAARQMLQVYEEVLSGAASPSGRT